MVTVNRRRNRNVIRIFVLLLAISLLASGCGNAASGSSSAAGNSGAASAQAPSQESANPASEEPVVVKYMTSPLTNEKQVRLQNMFDKYKEDTGRNVVIEAEYTPWDGYLDKFVTSVAAGSGPDASMFASMWLPTFQGMDVLVPLDDYYNSWDHKNDMPANIVQLYKDCSADGKLYLLPYSFVASYFTYRKDLFAEAGIESPPETMEEFLEACKKLTIDRDGDNKIDQYGFSMRANSNGQGGWFCFAFADMADPGFYEGGELSLTHPDVESAVQFWVDLYSVHGVVPPSAPMDGNSENINYLVSGTAAIMLHHFETAGEIRSQIGEENFGVFLPPTGKNGQRFSTIEENSTAVLNSSGDPAVMEAAAQFALWLVEPTQHDEQVQMDVTAPFIQPIVEKYIDDPAIAISAECLNYGEFTPSTPYMGEWTTKTWPSYVSRALQGEIEVGPMLKELADHMLNG